MPSLVEEIEKIYGVNIPSFPGSLVEARRAADEGLKYFMIYLHCPTHASTETFIQSVLGDPEVVETLRNQVVLYSSSVMEEEGWRLSKELSVTTYPALVTVFQRAIVMRLQGPYTKEELLAEWSVCTSNWDGVVAEQISLRHERAMQAAALSAENTQVEAMELADMERLAAFEAEERATEARRQQEAQERENKLRAEHEAAERLKAENAARQVAEAVAKAEAERRRAAAAAVLTAEPPEGSPGCDIAVVNLKALNGRQYLRRFWRTDRVDSILAFAESLPEHDGVELTLVMGFPPVPLSWAKGKTTIKEVKDLYPRAVVLVRRNA